MTTINKFTGNKSRKVKKLILDILEVLETVGIPFGRTDLKMTDRNKEKIAMACLAVGNIKSSFQEVSTNNFLKTRDVIAFENENFGESRSPGSYDDVRRKELILLVEAGIVIKSASVESQAVNDPTRAYAISPHFAVLLRAHGTMQWDSALQEFKHQTIALTELIQRKRDLEKIPVILPSGTLLQLSAGEHNILQKKIVEDFLPRFGFGSQLLYIGDTENKQLYKDESVLKNIGFFNLEHEELPDVVAYSQEKNLLFLIEAVHSTGPMSEIRVRKLRKQLENCTANPIFITAFLNKTTFRKWVVEIAWETEVWIADAPDHLVHFNGYKFLEIHK